MNPTLKHAAILRVLKSSGLYPATSFANKNALYYRDDVNHTVYTLVRFTLIDEARTKYAEIAWAFPSEIRLWATLVLSIPEGGGAVCISPSEESIQLSLPQKLPTDFRDKSLPQVIARQLQGKQQGLAVSQNTLQYRFQPFPTDLNTQHAIFAAINPRNDLLLRGLSCLMKSDILAENMLLTEEAALLCFISLTAALELLRKKISDGKGNNTTSFDHVFEHIASKWHLGENIAEYYRECWDNRTILVHPSSRFGIYSMDSLTAEDYLETRNSLVSFYRYLLVGETGQINPFTYGKAQPAVAE